jgi:hypothetical protein
MVVLAMGNWLAALISQVCHRRVVRHLARSPVSLLRPRFQPVARQRSFLALQRQADDGGMVEARQVPKELWQSFEGVEYARAARAPEFLHTLVPADFKIPVSAFAFEVKRICAGFVSPLPADAYVALNVVLISTGEDVRFAKELARQKAKARKQPQAMVAMSLYIDDEWGGVYEPRAFGSTSGYKDREAPRFAIGNTALLLSVFSALAFGLRESWKKLRWASNQPDVVLGVSYDFLPGRDRQMEFQVAPSRRRATAEAFRLLATSAEAFVDEDLLQTLLGNVVWEMLANRPALSIMRVVFKALHSPNRPAGRVLLSSALREEFLALSLLAPVFVRRTVDVCSTAAVFDASGKARHGNGGYGVALRTGLSPIVAAEFSTVFGTEGGKLPHFREPAAGFPPLDRTASFHHRESSAAASAFLSFDWQSRTATWQAAVFGEFKSAPRHVNVAEAVSGGMAFRRLCSDRRSRGLRVYIGGDNTASLHCFRRGRSSTSDINAVCRRVFLLGFIYDVSASWFWVPSASNPSDGPSRWWYKAKELWAAGRQAKRNLAVRMNLQAQSY